jgi:hypothetical protein
VGGGGGVTDHGALTGLSDDDHPQYLNNARGDARYDASGTAASAVSAHAGAADPHTGYQRESEKGAASGYASLDSGTKVPITQVPTGTSGTTVALGNHAHGGVYDPAGTAAAGDSAHTSAGDPHPQYATPAEHALIDHTGIPGVGGGGGSGLVGVYNVKDYGAVGDGTSDDTAEIQAALAAGAGAIVFVPEGIYKISADLEVPANTTLSGNGTIRQDTRGQAGVTIMGSGVTIDGITLLGTASVYTANEDAITATGTSAASPWTDITIRNVTAQTWGRHAVHLKYIDGFEVASCYLYDLYYSGVMVLSGANGRIHANRIDDLHGTADRYGIALTYGGTESATDPSTRDCVVDSNVITRVMWEAMDTHGGFNITFSNNVVSGCKAGISLNPGTTTSPTQIICIGNTVDGGTDVYSASRWGFQLVGKSAAIPASGVSLVGNTFHRCAEVYLRFTRGTIVNGNTMSEANGRGVFLYEHNTNFTISNNVIIDAWSDSSAASATAIATANGGAGSNIGIIHGNQMVRGSKTATYVNKYGALLNADPGNAFTVYGNDFSTAETTGITGTTVHRMPQFATESDLNSRPNAVSAASVLNTLGLGTNIVDGSATPGTYWQRWTGTQAAYDALGTYDQNTLYVVVG